jgi:glycosyltransferase involved in cell wall biosynthesis
MEFKNTFLNLLLWEQLALPILAHEMLADVTFSPANYGPLVAPNPVILLRNSLAVVQRERRLSKQLYWILLALATMLSLLTCRRAIAVSDYARRTLTFGLPSWVIKRMRVVHHGVSKMFSADSSVQRQDRLLLAVCDIYVQKNLHNLVRAIDALKATYPDIKLNIAGRIIDPDYHSELMTEIDRRGLGRHICFLGGCTAEQLVELYRTCTIFIFPSTIETFGNPLVEAMACQAPIASSKTAAMPEVVGDAARFFDPINVDDMASAITHLLDNPDERRRLGDLGLKRAGQYSWPLTAGKTADVLVEAGQKG